MNPLLLTDGYKTSHHKMYPEGTEMVYSNFTPRSVKFMPNEAKKILVFGIQYTAKYIKDVFDKEFFSQPKEKVIPEIKKFISSYVGSDYDVSHFEKLHDLGYLPIEIHALPEGTISKPQIPILTYFNTKKEFYWVTNFLETLISTLLWKPLHSASMAYGFKKILVEYCLETDKKSIDFVDFQGHDFSERGMQGIESALSSGMGFTTCFKGSDTLPVLWGNEYYYKEENSAFSVPASEHAVMTSYGKESEENAFNRILDLYPTGIVSIVSDSYDFWKIHTETIYNLKDKIMKRDGKTVFRGDSGEPIDIICGLSHKYSSYDEYAEYMIAQDKIPNQAEYKGQIELLWECFGGTTNEQGYKILDSHCGAIYGDGIGFERMKEISRILKEKGFASTNVVYGIGSFSMGYATRDSQGSAVKATACIVKGEFREIFKDPITDSGKKSAKGLLMVYLDENGEYALKDQCTWEEVYSEKNQLKPIFKDGVLLKEVSLAEIRERAKIALEKDLIKEKHLETV